MTDQTRSVSFPTDDAIAKVQAQIIQTQVVYQDTNCYLRATEPQRRWKPFTLTADGIQYNGTVIEIDQAELNSLKAIDTLYGVFCLYPVEPPSWVFSPPIIRYKQAERFPVMAIENPCAIPAAIAILDLTTDFTIAELKKSYRQLAKQYHPDGQAKGNVEKFIEVQAAYQLLAQTAILDE